MLFTAGSQNQCTDEDDLEPVASSTVRLMNVAFGDESDSELDELASETNGLTYTVETSGICTLKLKRAFLMLVYHSLYEAL